jgi:protein arginine kinase
MFDQIIKTPDDWMVGKGPASQVVFSTRIRLARNLAGFFFLSNCSEEQKQEIINAIRDAVMDAEPTPNIIFVDMDEIDSLQRQVLVERHMISRHHAFGEGKRAVVILPRKQMTMMINEEDHLRIQVIRGGLQIDDAWEQICRIDDSLEKKLTYAFHPRFGYLTACPTNAGTGLRISVMMHLPGLKMSKEIDKLFRAAKDMRLAVRGLYGEGTEASGDFFQISNQVTLGKSEIGILKDFRDHVVPAVVDYELAARKALLKNRPHELDDSIFRALGLLTHARSMTSQEAISLLSQLRLGLTMERIEGRDAEFSTAVNELLFSTQPGHVQQLAGKELSALERRRYRASYIRQKLDGHADKPHEKN